MAKLVVVKPGNFYAGVEEIPLKKALMDDIEEGRSSYCGRGGIEDRLERLTEAVCMVIEELGNREALSVEFLKKILPYNTEIKREETE